MNKNDIILVAALFMLMLFYFVYPKNNNMIDFAIVKYQGETVLELDLTKKERQFFEIMGTNGLIIIETDFGKVRVIEETSPYNLCSKKGWVDQVYDIIVCLPNEVVIEVYGNSQIDAIIY